MPIKSDHLNISSVQDSKATQMKSALRACSLAVLVPAPKPPPNIASNLTPNNLTIETTKEDINITGSNIDAQQQLSLNSAKDINIKAGYDGSLNESITKHQLIPWRFSWNWTTLHLYRRLRRQNQKNAVNSTLSGNNITLNANNNIMQQALTSKQTIASVARQRHQHPKCQQHRYIILNTKK
ncbi:hypothetical protein BSPWISOXPB_7342 [uncultured Gammaproteobacteria bacterium]|nr:hypothetical protein BSPWISOXPB_7342 [uncultured Gammaproteobacteria bacterium]